MERPLNVCGEVQPSISTSSIRQRNEAPVSFAEKVNVAEVLLSVPEGPELMIVLGGVLSAVIVRPVEVVVLRPISVARAVMVTGPLLVVVESQITP